MKERLAFWSKIIGVDVPKTYRIPHKAMVDLGENCRAYRFCGFCPITDTIFYQGKLKNDDMVHELLHKKFPQMSHEHIRVLTTIIIKTSKISIPP